LSIRPKREIAAVLAQEPSLYLGDLLRADLALKTGLPRGESTRRRLLIAATDIIQKDGFAHLTVAAICKAAGFAHGTFYLHWSDRRAIASDIISDLMVAIRQHRPRSPDGTDFYERLVIGHRYYVAMYRQNSGLMLCQWQLADEIPGFSAIGASANRALADRVLRAAAREPYRLSEPADQQLENR
jgi:AcrR family transcriptional regulator